MQAYNIWTEEETNFLIENHSKKTNKQIGAILKRDPESVRARKVYLSKIGIIDRAKTMKTKNISPNYKRRDISNSESLFLSSYQFLFKYSETLLKKTLQRLKVMECKYSLFIGASFCGASVKELSEVWGIDSKLILRSIKAQVKDYINEKVSDKELHKAFKCAFNDSNFEKLAIN